MNTVRTDVEGGVGILVRMWERRDYYRDLELKVVTWGDNVEIMGIWGSQTLTPALMATRI